MLAQDVNRGLQCSTHRNIMLKDLNKERLSAGLTEMDLLQIWI